MSEENSLLNDGNYELPKHRKKRILEDLDAIENGEEEVTLLSSSKKKEKQKPSKEEEERETHTWITSLANLSQSKIKSSKSAKDIFGKRGKKGKKDKKKDNEPTDYAKEFEPEIALIDNLLVEQSRFTESLQQKYDRMESAKSQARGTGKYTTDLISNINTARDLSAKLINQKISTKKTIAELEMKERKELGAGVDESDLNNYAAEYLKNLINNKHSMGGSFGDISIEDADDGAFSDLIDSTVDDNRGDEVAAYLKYENRNVQIEVIMNPNDLDDYEFVAYADDGEELDDYPLPEHTSMSVNRSTMIATDTYGKKYHMEWKED